MSSTAFHQLAISLDLPNFVELLLDCPKAYNTAAIMQWILVPENARRLHTLHLLRLETVRDPRFFVAFNNLAVLALDFTPLAGLSKAYWNALVHSPALSALTDLCLVHIEPQDAQGLIVQRNAAGHQMLRELQLIFPAQLALRGK
uniref:Uncharacterized protein n=1 Tax=Mycena chlorophos TaxID=658473 RepID=A0ABQ0LWJ6_MYCCL|nr:predicted protein [Mycena chlorophos]